jgi:hypothetical protein
MGKAAPAPGRREAIQGFPQATRAVALQGGVPGGRLKPGSESKPGNWEIWQRAGAKLPGTTKKN